MKHRTARCSVVAIAGWLLAGFAGAKAPSKNAPAKALPSYEEIVRTYPDGVPLCQTNADVVGGNDQQLSLEGGYIAVNDEGEQRYQCYGSKLTVRKKVTLKGKTYRPGSKLTVDKDLYWIEVSGWDDSQAQAGGGKPSPSSADPQKAPSDVTGPPEGAEKSPSGLASRVLRQGTGATHPNPWDEVAVHYTGWMTNGSMFDSSAARGPSTFRLDQVIAGWTEGLQLMVVGEVRRLWIPAKLAYGDTPRHPGGPSGMLVFDVELLKILPGKKPIEAPRDVSGPPPDAVKTASGLAYVTLAKGRGNRRPKASDRVRVHYSGWTTDGKLFDSSVARGEPAQFRLDGVIRGWTEGVQLMVIGDKTRFWIPAELAYGHSTRPGTPSGMLVFEIELLDIVADD